MPRKSMINLAVCALSAIGFAGLAIWLTERLADIMGRATTRALDAGNYATQATVESLIHLLVPEPPAPRVEQPSDTEWLAGATVVPDGIEPGLDDEDWTVVAESELDDRLEPETILIPLEQRRVLTGIPAPDLSGETY